MPSSQPALDAATAPPLGPAAPDGLIRALVNAADVPPDLIQDFGDLLSRWGLKAASPCLLFPEGFYQDLFFVRNRDLLFSFVIRGYVAPSNGGGMYPLENIAPLSPR